MRTMDEADQMDILHNEMMRNIRLEEKWKARLAREKKEVQRGFFGADLKRAGKQTGADMPGAELGRHLEDVKGKELPKRKQRGVRRMFIRVMYQNGELGMVKPFQLDKLIASGKIKKFLRSEGWVTIGVGPIRGMGGELQRA